MALTPVAQVITPNDHDQQPRYPTRSIFLAGPTDFNWRQGFITALKQRLTAVNITIFDPFQPRWDATWKEDVDTDPRFAAQVDWELSRQEGATTVAVFFHADSQAPISLLELGLCARSGKAVVGCEPGYWKRGNVQAVCRRYGVPLADSLDGLAHLAAAKLARSKA
ncbi:hypothetical protein KVR01_003319 [Diaporthe batatas]|uniref:uncharacterized protein n=1 Tax=Diaporthe batatas TaxID=748121 RepID=UPI001D05A4D0|nr:uncharacterized protein KVR01_003319 [Diaporthe batatas]KAG8167630.1 hypothetical protein KVR01_003319 [Diaporthe batatas]